MLVCYHQAVATAQLKAAALPAAAAPLPAAGGGQGTPRACRTHATVARVPRSPRSSPPSSPRSPLDPTDPQLVRQLRSYLVSAAQRPPGLTEDVEALLSSKLCLDAQEIEAIFTTTTSSSSSRHQQQPAQEQLLQLQKGLDQLLRLFSTSELAHLLQQQPALLQAPLASWCDFFDGYGFTPSQTKNLISQTHGEVLTKGTLVTAGAAIMHLKSLGFDNDEVRHRVVAYCPQVLAMSTTDIDLIIRLWSKFSVGVDERTGM